MPNNTKQPLVVVAMSGGVDSSVAALLLKKSGYEVIGITMRLASADDTSMSSTTNQCCGVEDVEDARRVCQIIGSPHYYLNFEKEFQQHVIDYFCSEYQKGRTPHPCIACNDRIKFDFLLERAKFMGADYIATGHYARIKREGSQYKLIKGIDPSKDQSYVLFNLKQSQLQTLLLPVGKYSKADIRQLALESNLPVADKPDSQEICFIPSNNYKEYIQNKLHKTSKGAIVNTRGQRLGTHDGIEFYTIGQRRGLGIELKDKAFVTKIDHLTNTITIGNDADLMCSTAWVSNLNYLSGITPKEPFEATVKIRYKSPPSTAIVQPNGAGALITFSRAQRAITPGQALVIYRNDEVLGGGFIDSTSIPETNTKTPNPQKQSTPTSLELKPA